MLEIITFVCVVLLFIQFLILDNAKVSKKEMEKMIDKKINEELNRVKRWFE